MLAAIWLLPAGGHAQDKASQLLKELHAAYDRLDYAEAETKANEALQAYQQLSVEQLAEVHTTLGLIYFTQNRTLEARRHFESALSLRPELDLDPNFVSPKILQFFEQVKTEWTARRSTPADQAPAEARYIILTDPRPAATLRSMVFPGWGQLYKGQRRKGWVLAGLWGASLVGSVATTVARNRAQDRYQAETDPDRIEARYDTFNRWHKVRNGFLSVSAAIWVYGFVDALVSGGPPEAVEPQARRLEFRPWVSPEHASLSVRLRF